MTGIAATRSGSACQAGRPDLRKPSAAHFPLSVYNAPLKLLLRAVSLAPRVWSMPMRDRSSPRSGEPDRADATNPDETDPTIQIAPRVDTAGESLRSGGDDGKSIVASIVGSSSSSSPEVSSSDESANSPAPLAIVGHFELQRQIGQGGMGTVYRAYDTQLQRDVAIKVLTATEDQVFFSQGKLRFINEAQITGQLQHPGVPPVHELGTLDDGRPYLAMKLVQGETLGALLKRRSSPAEDRSRFIAIFEQ
ncbi:MAG TPA: hypothetical protein ENJ50_08525, partial [Planctomycetaceae bacterium]|nr:hypothetical protein [Planctomycetaceae bacterium]